ncbi:hypothetical protein EsH8_VI_001059 [Colletotrichum jinshuiense]
MKLSFFTAISSLTLALAAPSPKPITYTELGPSVSIPRSEPPSTLPRSDVELVSRASMETVTCYNIGTAIPKSFAEESITQFCEKVKGSSWGPNSEFFQYFTQDNVRIRLSGATINGCSWTVDDNCSRLLDKIMHSCDKDMVDAKRGGFLVDSCGLWRADPGSLSDDF